jgi:Mismatch repair ATPase (MutS family)
MAGMPPSLIERANDILKQLETKHVGENSQESGVGSQESHT